MSTVSLEERQADVRETEDALARAAKRWLEARAAGRRNELLEIELSSHLVGVRAARRRLEQTERRLAKRAASTPNQVPDRNGFYGPTEPDRRREARARALRVDRDAIEAATRAGHLRFGQLSDEQQQHLLTRVAEMIEALAELPDTGKTA